MSCPRVLWSSLTPGYMVCALFRPCPGNILTPQLGSDGVDDDDRMYQCYFYVRDVSDPGEPDSNYYALPLSISPVISADQQKVIHIDYLPTGSDTSVKEPQPFKVRPANEYIPERQELRKDLKPLHVVQPEGASFKVIEQGTSNVIQWQKWSFRVGFNRREGPILYNVRTQS